METTTIYVYLIKSLNYFLLCNIEEFHYLQIMLQERWKSTADSKFLLHIYKMQGNKVFCLSIKLKYPIKNANHHCYQCSIKICIRQVHRNFLCKNNTCCYRNYHRRQGNQEWQYFNSKNVQFKKNIYGNVEKWAIFPLHQNTNTILIY